MAASLTTGPEIMGTSAGFIAFCAVGMAFTRYANRWLLGREHADRLGRLSQWVWLALAAVGAVALVVGLVAWLTGTTFSSK